MARPNEDNLVIVAVDGSPNSETALVFYLEKLHKPGFTVGLLHSYEKPSITIHAPVDSIKKVDVSEINKKFRHAWDFADEIIAKYKKICQDHGVENIKEFLEHGKKPGEAICGVAEKEKAALIVVGNRGQSVLRRTLLGSVSEYVVMHSKESVVLVVPMVDKVEH